MANDISDARLLQRYALARDEAAFAALVESYLPLVYGAALRQLNDAATAQDVAQKVFTTLARRATWLQHNALGGWLYRTTVHIAQHAARAEKRRRQREQIAMEIGTAMKQDSSLLSELAPVLDEALLELRAAHREALVLRYFANKSLREVGDALGIREDAAQKRVGKALEALTERFRRRGFRVAGAAAISVVLDQTAASAIPVGLAAAVTSNALASAAGGIGTSLTLLHFMTMTKLKICLLSAFVVAGIATPLALQHQGQARLRDENTSLRLRLDQMAQLQTENERLSNELATAISPSGSAGSPDSELLRLRGEVSRLRADARELGRLRSGSQPAPAKAGAAVSADNPLWQKLALMPDKSIPELQLLNAKKWDEDASKGNLSTEEGVREALSNLRRAAKIRFAYSAGQALGEFAKATGGQLPGDILDLKPYFNPPADDALLQRYELLHTGKLSDFPPGQALLAERAPVDDKYDTVIKIAKDGFTIRDMAQRDDAATTFRFPWATEPRNQAAGK